MTTAEQRKAILAYRDSERISPKLAQKQDEVVIQSYITQRLSPFDDYQFADQDEIAVQCYVTQYLSGNTTPLASGREVFSREQK